MSQDKRRSRVSRAQLRPASIVVDSQLERSARRRSRLLRIGLLLSSVFIAALIVHGFGPPLTYRLGQRPTREIRVNVPSFQLKNQRKTNAAIQEASDRVLPVMDCEPAPIRELSQRLIDLTEAISRAPDRGALPETIRSSWNLDQAAFDEIKIASDTPERRDDLKRRILDAFDPLIRNGILGPDTLPSSEDRALAVLVRDPDRSQAREVPIDFVRPERLVKADGPLAAQFVASFTNRSLGLRLFNLVAEKLAGTPTLTYDERATSAARKLARESVRDVYDTYQRGDLLLEQDQPITEDYLALLRQEHLVQSQSLTAIARVKRALAVLVLVGALFALVSYYVVRNEPDVASDTKRILRLCVLVLATLGIARLIALQPWDAELVPIALTAMILAVAFNPHFALMVTFATSLLLTLSIGQGISHFLVLMGGTAAGVAPLNDVRSRSKPIEVGAVAALGYFTLTWATGLWLNQPVGLIASDSLWRAGWGIMAGFFLGGILPFIERAFGIVTGISLLELGDINHPLLQELVRRAPGTYNHSVTVGTIAEAAAERIGANSLLIRVGSYFHDIGKMVKPQYFVENQMGAPSRHANLAPAMSTLIIIGHVKDGLDLAHQHNLPEPIIDLILQHHGTTLVEFFFREARNRSESNPDAPVALESSFRYPGPKPQSREAGILLIADAVESASRTLSDPTPSRIEGLVDALVEKRLKDGQFDESGLTLRDIAIIRESLIKSLIGIYHGRVKYPEQRSA